MKKIPVLAASLTLILSHLAPAATLSPATSPKELVYRLIDAAKTRDVEAMRSLYFNGGANDEPFSESDMDLIPLVTQRISGMEFMDLPDDYDAEYVYQGERIRPNIPLLGQIEFTFFTTPEGEADPGNPFAGIKSFRVLYGQYGHAYYLPRKIKEPLPVNNAAETNQTEDSESKDGTPIEVNSPPSE